MEGVCAALQHEIELASGGMTEFRCVLILENRKFGNRVIRDRNERPGYALAVIVDAFHREVVVAWALPANAGARTRANAAAARHTGTQKGKIKDSAGTERGAGKVCVHLRIKRGRKCGSRGVQRFSDA